MLIDLHCHTKYSRDNPLEPLAFVRRAKALGLDAVCVTEHNSVEASAPVVALGREEGLLVLQGVEVSTEWGHILCYGLVDDAWRTLRERYFTPVESLAAFAAAHDAVLVPAHPFRSWSTNAAGSAVYDMTYITALEVVNANNAAHENARAREAATTLHLAGIGGSDSHYEDEVARAATCFPQDIGSMADLVEALRGDGYYPVCRTLSGTFVTCGEDGRPAGVNPNV